MSIANEINRITANVASAYVAAAEKNAEMPELQNSENLAATILSIPEYEEPTMEALEVSANGEYTPGEGVDGFHHVAVNVQPKLQDKTVTPATDAQTVKPDTGFDGLGLVEVQAVKTAGRADVNVVLNANQGRVAVSATQAEGYVTADEWAETLALPTIAGETITPGTTARTIQKHKYLMGDIVVEGDANLVSENIKKGVSIFGVAGTAEGGGSGGGSAGGESCTVTVINTDVCDGYFIFGYLSPDGIAKTELLKTSGNAFAAKQGSALSISRISDVASIAEVPSGSVHMAKNSIVVDVVPLVGDSCIIEIVSAFDW